MGTACTERNPAVTARGANLGHGLSGSREIQPDDGRPTAIAVDTGPLIGLGLEHLQQPHGLAGGGQHPQLPVGGGQHEPDCGRVSQLCAAVCEQTHQVHYVEVVDEAVGQLDEGTGQQRFS